MTAGLPVDLRVRTTTDLEVGFAKPPADDRGTGSFSPVNRLAIFLDGLFDRSEPETTSNFQFFTQQQGLELPVARGRLSASARARLNQFFSETDWQRCLALSQERDPRLFFQGWLQWGQQLAYEEKDAQAILALEGLEAGLQTTTHLGDEVKRKLLTEASSLRKALLGQGPWQESLPFTARRLTREMVNPISLSTMALAGLAYHGVRLATLGRLSSVGRASFFTRGWGAHLLASGVGFGAEVGTFVGAGRGLRHLAGLEQDWSARGIWHEVLATTMMLSALKFTGWGSRMAVGRFPVTAPGDGFLIKNLWQLPHRALPQVGMLMGIMGAAKGEMALGLREEIGGSQFWVESLATLFHFNVAGRLLESLPSYRRTQADFQGKFKDLLASQRRTNSPPPGTPVEHWALASGQVPLNTKESPLPHILLSENQNGDGGNKAGGKSKNGDGVTGTKGETKGDGVNKGGRNGNGNGNGKLDSAEKRVIGLQKTIENKTPAPLEPMADPDYQVEPGKYLRNGLYRVERLLGEGGMGKVYQVTDTKLNRPAVIKVPRPGLVGTEFIQRFEREQRIGASLDDRWRVTIFEIIKLPNNQEVPVMDYVPGYDLRTILHEIDMGKPSFTRHFNLEKRLEIFAKICEGVQATHDMGIVHRDLKPENIRVTKDMGIRIMDYGVARWVTEEDSVPVGENKIPEQGGRSGRVTRAGSFPGTPGYMPPELLAPNRYPSSNPFSADIFGLGVILYETITVKHPFAHFDLGRVELGEPELVPRRNTEGSTEINWGAPMGSGGRRSPKNSAPAFRQVMSGPEDPFFSPVEKRLWEIFTKATHPDANQRYSSAQKLREDILMLRPLLDKEEFYGLREQMGNLESELQTAWKKYQPGKPITQEQWQGMNDPIEILKNLHRQWHMRGENLVIKTLEIMKGERWFDGQRLIAKVTWERLLDYGDRIDRRVADTMKQRIIDNDVPDAEGKTLGMGKALRGKLPIELRSLEVGSSKLLSKDFQIQLTSLVKERDLRGNELGNYETGQELFQGNYSDLKNDLHLPAGYYLMKVFREGYAPMQIPLQIDLQGVRRGLMSGRSLRYDLRWVPEDRVPKGMQVIHHHQATIGHDYYNESGPFDLYTQPQKTVVHPTFLMGERPVSVQEYAEYIDALLVEGVPEEEVKLLIPQRKTELSRPSSSSGTTEEQYYNSQVPKSFFWQIVTETTSGKDGEVIRKRLAWPENPTDAYDDPLNLGRPIEEINLFAAQKYVDWRSKRDGFNYRIPSIEELEAVARNSFPWTYPWGFNFDPFKTTTSLAFAVTDKTSDITVQEIGTHPLGKSADRSLFGPIDLIGNVREFSSTEAAPGCVYFFGGSVRTGYGPFFRPPSRVFAFNHTVDSAWGGFRLVLDLEERSGKK